MAPRRILLDFEKPLVDLEEQIEQIRAIWRGELPFPVLPH